MSNYLSLRIAFFRLIVDRNLILQIPGIHRRRPQNKNLDIKMYLPGFQKEDTKQWPPYDCIICRIMLKALYNVTYSISSCKMLEVTYNALHRQ